MMKEKAMQSMSTLSSAQIVAGLPHPAYHHTVPQLIQACLVLLSQSLFRHLLIHIRACRLVYLRQSLTL